MSDLTEAYLEESLAALAAFRDDAQARATLVAMADRVTAAMRAGRKLLIAGNGGSAADAQHMAGEIVGRLWLERAPLPAIALTVDSSILTAVGNDYGYEHVFERQVIGLGQEGDVFLGISTSGRTPNILRAFAAAEARGMARLGFTGSGDSPMPQACDLLLRAPSPKTSVIQQIHIVAVHVLCGLIEQAMFPAQAPPYGNRQSGIR
ncbi:MAG TPA: D-sedoheptulose 7-phosphate isomerase [Acetobacteraceae bacterium]|nr:D-sedoheptulose 7-phosphate isomerase [Acetobacteraceae bacterium]